MMKKILDHLEIPYVVGIGEAAFTVLSLTFKLKMFMAKRIHLSPFKLTKCFQKNLVWNMLTKTVLKTSLHYSQIFHWLLRKNTCFTY